MMHIKRRCSSRHFRAVAAGVGIIEVLVALVVVSIGVLGVAGLQLTSMKHSNGGYNRFRAILAAENMAARMRTNEAGANNTGYDAFDSETDVNCAAKPTPYCQSTNLAEAQNCTRAQMATFDLFSVACGNWSAAGEAENGVVDELANGRLRVSCDENPCAATSNYTVLITWEENTGISGNENAPDTKQVRVKFNP